MESSEPSLVPEWLRNSGNIGGGGNSAHHCVSVAHSSRNQCSKIGVDKNSRSGSFLDRIASGNSRNSSSNNGSSKHPYSSFNRNPRDRNRGREKDKPVTRDLWELDNFDPLGNILGSRTEKDTLRHSCALLSRKPSESLPRKSLDVKSYGNNNHLSNNGVLRGGARGSGAQRAAFDKDFPSLGIEERLRGADVHRVPSPGRSKAMQSFTGGERWTSALAEVPSIIGSTIRPKSIQHAVPANASSVASSPLAGLNMAEALSQGPARALTPELPDKTQMLEELAIKQSKQLIPMTPSMPKGLVHNSDKLKPKTSLRTGEPVVVVKSVQQQQQPQSSQLANQSVCGGQVKSETASVRSLNGGKFLVLKPFRDNGVAVVNDVAGMTNNSSKLVINPLAGASVAANVKSPNSSKGANVEGKVSALSLHTGPFGEKRPSLSQVQSRSDFFKLMRKKSSKSAPGSSALTERSAEVAESLVSSCISENGSKMTSNGDAHEEKNLCSNGTVYPDEEEAAFLRSLGWDENAEEDDGLTEEEINAFYEEFVKMKPSLKLCRDVEQKITSLCESHTTGSSRASSELSFSETEIEA